MNRTAQRHGRRRCGGRGVRAALLLALLAAVLATGCHAARVYGGRVVFAESGEPVVGEQVSGSWTYRGRFYPHHDGLFLRKGACTDVTTDSDGCWQLRLEGFNRNLRVFRTGYQNVFLRLDGWPRDKDVLIQLVPLPAASDE